MNETVKRIRRELNKFLGSNRINTKMLYQKAFQESFDFPVSGRTVYRIVRDKKNPTLTTQEKILNHFGIPYKKHINRLEILEDEKSS